MNPVVNPVVNQVVRNPYIRPIRPNPPNNDDVNVFSEPGELLADQTIRGQNRAIHFYNEFAKKHHQPLFKNLKKTDILGEKGEQLGALFGVYILHLKQDGGKHYGVGTKVGYFRGWLAGLDKVQKFKSAVSEARSTWFPDVVKKVEMRASVAAIRRGEAISRRKRPIRRALLLRLVKHVLKSNSPEAYRMRAVLNMLRSSVGRSGEVSTASWAFSEWSPEDDVLLMNWPEVKTGMESTLSYGPDIDWQLDVIHSIGSYLVTNQGGATSDGDVNWLFPFLSKLSGNNAAANKVNNYIKSCIGQVSLPIFVFITTINSLVNLGQQYTRWKGWKKIIRQVVYDREVQMIWLQIGRAIKSLPSFAEVGC